MRVRNVWGQCGKEACIHDSIVHMLALVSRSAKLARTMFWVTLRQSGPHFYAVIDVHLTLAANQSSSGHLV